MLLFKTLSWNTDGGTGTGGVTEELRIQGWVVNHKRIARIIRENNLLAARKDWLQPAEHSLRAARIYPNLANRMTVLGPHQLWVADITYIRLVCEFVYLAVVLDAFSRKVLGWAKALRRNLQCVRWSERLLIGGRLAVLCTIPTRACSTQAKSTCKHCGSTGCSPV